MFMTYSYIMGMVTSSYDVAAMIVTPLISYIGGSRKKPVFCAWGVLTMGVGFFIFILPHFVSPPYEAGMSAFEVSTKRKKSIEENTNGMFMSSSSPIRCPHECHCEWLGTLRGKSNWFWREKWLQRRNRQWKHSLLRALHSGNGGSGSRLYSHDYFGSSIYRRKCQRQGVTYVCRYTYGLWNYWLVVMATRFKSF